MHSFLRALRLIGILAFSAFVVAVFVLIVLSTVH